MDRPLRWQEQGSYQVTSALSGELPAPGREQADRSQKRHQAELSGISLIANIPSTGGEPSRAYHRSLGHPDHQLAPLRGNERADRGIEQSDQADQTSSVRFPELRQLQNPSTPIRRETELDTPHNHHSPLISDDPPTTEDPVVGPCAAAVFQTLGVDASGYFHRTPSGVGTVPQQVMVLSAAMAQVCPVPAATAL